MQKYKKTTAWYRYSLAVNYYKYTIENLTQLIKYKKSQIFASICPCKDMIDNESTISLL